MNHQVTESASAHLMAHFSFNELSQFCKISIDELNELMDYEIIKPEYKLEEEYFFSTETLNLLVLACKQRNDLDMELFSIVTNYQYLERIQGLQNTIQKLHALSKY